jgi:hypothetical protein
LFGSLVACSFFIMNVPFPHLSTQYAPAISGLPCGWTLACEGSVRWQQFINLFPWHEAAIRLQQV